MSGQDASPSIEFGGDTAELREWMRRWGVSRGPGLVRHAHPYDERKDGRGFTRAECVGTDERRCGPFSKPCPRHNATYYTDYMARHASNVHGTGSIYPVDRDPWSGRS